MGCDDDVMNSKKFLQCLKRSLETLTAVDTDAESAFELKARIARQLPNVRSAVYEDVAENWAAGTDQVFDVVMLHNCVSDIPKSAVQPAFRVRDQAKRPFHNHHADQTL